MLCSAAPRLHRSHATCRRVDKHRLIAVRRERSARGSIAVRAPHCLCATAHTPEPAPRAPQGDCQGRSALERASPLRPGRCLLLSSDRWDIDAPGSRLWLHRLHFVADGEVARPLGLVGMRGRAETNRAWVTNSAFEGNKRQCSAIRTLNAPILVQGATPALFAARMPTLRSRAAVNRAVRRLQMCRSRTPRLTPRPSRWRRRPCSCGTWR